MKEFATSIVAFDIAIELKNDLHKRGIDESVFPYTTDGVAQKVDYERIFTNRANAKLALGDLQGALDDCNLAIKTNPSYSNSYIVAGIILANAGQTQQALNALSKAQQMGNPNALNLIHQIQSNL
jgi:tetratricopeptide (TPR) repeat protein